ncbi:MAG: acyl-CoA thioesterase [Gemmatimonadota bacterium]|nr:acyl-CoA thioesterase [Gemmatimonadota bacterium]
MWCEIGRTEHMRALGSSYSELERAGVKLAVAEATVRYQLPARYDEMVKVETTLESVGSRMLTFSYALTNADTGERLATASTTLIVIDGAGLVTRLPEEVRDALARGGGPAA